ncbi:MAG: ECF-type sigma factor [Rubricoccaceae bacterium]
MTADLAPPDLVQEAPASPHDGDTIPPQELDADVARLLGILGHNDGAPEQCGVIYEQLRQIAHAHRMRWIGTPSVCTTALVHEAYLKLARSSLRFRSRTHFMMTSSRAMRQVLVTYAEAQCTQKRGGGKKPLPLDDASGVVLSDDEAEEIAGIGEALRRLERWDERGARVVECRFFAGLTVDETAEVLGLSPATVTRCWRSVRLWLYNELDETASV